MRASLDREPVFIGFPLDSKCSARGATSKALHAPRQLSAFRKAGYSRSMLRWVGTTEDSDRIIICLSSFGWACSS